MISLNVFVLNLVSSSIKINKNKHTDFLTSAGTFNKKHIENFDILVALNWFHTFNKY